MAQKLTTLGSNYPAKVERVEGNDWLQSYLSVRGIVPGAKIVRRKPMTGGIVLVSVEGMDFAFSKQYADKVWVSVS